MRVALAQISPKLSRANLQAHEEIIKAQVDQADLVLFPELSLNGYMLLDKVYEEAFVLEELASLALLSNRIDIAVGAVLRTKKRVYNAALYFSKGELLHRHYKNRLPSYGMFEESRYFVAGDTISAFENRFGRCAMVVCEDLWHAETTQQIARLDIDYLFVLAASPARGFSDEGLDIAMQWRAILQTTALFGKCEVIFVNRVGFEDGVGFWGGSMIIGSDAKVVAALPEFETALQTHDLRAGRFDARHLIAK